MLGLCLGPPGAGVKSKEMSDEEALEESRATTDAILEAAADGILTIDQEGAIESVNAAAVRMFGYTRDELVGRNVKLLMPAPYHDEHDAYLERYLQTQEARIIGVGREVEGQRKDGSIFPLRLSVGEAVLRDRHVFVGIVHDLSNERQLQLSQRESAARTQAIVEAAVDAIATIDERGTIESVNPALERLFGYKREELLRENIKVLMPEPYASEHDGYLATYRETGRRKIIGIGREVEGLRKDGSVFPMYLSVSEVEVGGRRLYAGNMHDLSAQKELEGQLLQSQKMEAIGPLAGGVAHDFNNLLTSIMGSAELGLGRVEPGTPVARSFQRVKLAADRGEALTKQLLAFSRKQVTKPEILDFNGAVREARELFERMIGEDIALKLDLGSDVGSVRVDPGQLDQVIINLVVNARDAMPDGGELTLSTRSETLDERRAMRLSLGPGAYSILAIRDTGVGISEEVRRQIFEPFFTTKGPGRGTGLGLSTALGIVRRHGGAIDVSSRPSCGTTFEVLFPRVAAEMRAEPTPEDQERPAALQGKTILIVEDDALMRDLMAEVLELEGYQVIDADTPEAGLARAAEHEVHLVVTDVVMPQMTGFELVRRLRQAFGGLRVIYMSGYTDQVLADRGELSEGDAFLRKPFGNDDLTAKIVEVLSAPPPETR